jgi:hypothetical protein
MSKPPSGFGDDVIFRNEHIGEFDIGSQLQPVAHLEVGLTDRDTVGVHVDQQHHMGAVHDAQHGHNVGGTRVRDPTFAAR